jgi:hypothetical protein
MAARGWRGTVFGRGNIPFVEKIALSERDLAWVRTRRHVLPLYGDT